MVSFRSSFRPRAGERAQTNLKVVLPISGGASDQRLLDAIAKLCHRRKADLTLVYVVEVEQSMPLDAELPEEVGSGEAVLRHAAESLRRELDGSNVHIYTELLQARSAGAAIVDEATDKNADMIVLAATLRRQYGYLTVGETVDYVLKYAPCEVIVIRQALPDWITESMEWS